MRAVEAVLADKALCRNMKDPQAKGRSSPGRRNPCTAHISTRLLDFRIPDTLGKLPGSKTQDRASSHAVKQHHDCCGFSYDIDLGAASRSFTETHGMVELSR